MSYPQQQYGGGPYQPSINQQNFQANPAWHQQAQPGPSFPQQQHQSPYPSIQQSRPGNYPGPPQGQGYPQHQQQQMAAAMMAQRQQGPGAPQQQGSMGPPQMIPGMAALAGIPGMTREHQLQAVNMMQQQQAAILQQQRLQAEGGGGGSGSGGGAASGPAPRKKKAKAPPPQQMIPRQPPPPRTNESFRQAAMAASNEVEPWADGLDEVDPRELAMGRFRTRQETLSEIFSPDSIKDILAVEYDPWSGLGTDAETLEQRVAQLESENESLSSRMDSDVEVFRKRLADAEGVDVSSVEVPA